MLLTFGIISGIFILLLIVARWRYNNKEYNVAYLKKDDPNAQENYLNLKYSDKPKLTMQELIDLSWKFLYNLSEIVINKFSVQDQQEVLKNGKVMMDYGMKYQHTVENNPLAVESYTKKISAEKAQTQQQI